MGLLFVILLTLSIWHFIYDGILLPSIRLELRYKLFALRDKLRELKDKHGNDLDEEVFKYLDVSLSNSIRLIPIVNLRIVRKVNRMVEKDKNLKKKIEEKVSAINSSKVSEAKDIFDLMVKYSAVSAFANGGGWLLYVVILLIPIAFVLLLLQMMKTCKRKIRESIQEVSLTPESEMSGVYYYSEVATV